MNSNSVIISGKNMELTDALKSLVHDKAEKLFRIEEGIIRLRVELEYNMNRTRQEEYIAHGHITIDGPTLDVAAASDDLYKSVDQMVQKLARKLRKRARYKRFKRKNTSGIDIPAALPKISA